MVRDLGSSPSADGTGGFDRYCREDTASLIGFLIKLGADPEEARDAFQTTMIEVYSRWDNIESPRAYARTTAERVFLKSRARAADESDRLAKGGWGVDRTPNLPLDMVIFKEQAAELIELMRQLPPTQRRVLAWHLDGFSNKEIAERFGEKPSTVASNLRHANSAMRKLWIERKQRAAATGRRAADERSGA